MEQTQTDLEGMLSILGWLTLVDSFTKWQVLKPHLSEQCKEMAEEAPRYNTCRYALA